MFHFNSFVPVSTYWWKLIYNCVIYKRFRIIIFSEIFYTNTIFIHLLFEEFDLSVALSSWHVGVLACWRCRGQPATSHPSRVIPSTNTIESLQKWYACRPDTLNNGSKKQTIGIEIENTAFRMRPNGILEIRFLIFVFPSRLLRGHCQRVSSGRSELVGIVKNAPQLLKPSKNASKSAPLI